MSESVLCVCKSAADVLAVIERERNREKVFIFKWDEVKI